MFLSKFLRFLISVLILYLIGIGLLDYLKNFDENECSMTYMFQPPNLIPVNLNNKIAKKYSNYKLYLYCEGYDCEKYESLKFNEPGHIPVLFITGNADSHMQVRSLASISIDKSRKMSKSVKFHFFTISFNEELSALYGPILNKQTDYAKHCIKHILSLFSNIKPESKIPRNVLVVGNSMGGVVARNIFLPSEVEFDTNLVHTVITKATPHNRPVVNLDYELSKFYDNLNNFWLNKSKTKLSNVVLASLYGGHRDILVRSGLSNINDWKFDSPAGIISSLTLSMPHVWRSIDHRCMAWCRELVLTINRALFDLVDPNTQQINQDKTLRETTLKYHFERDFSKPLVDKLEFKGELTKLENKSEFNFDFNFFNDKLKIIYFDIELVLKSGFDSLFLYTNINEKNSFIACKNALINRDNDEHTCDGVKDLMYEFGRTIPPFLENHRKESSLKTITLLEMNKNLLKQGFKYLIITIPVYKKKGSRHQIVLKLDWFKASERIDHIDSSTGGIRFSFDKNSHFHRYPIYTIKKILNTYDLLKTISDDSCDKYLKKKINLKPPLLSASSVLMQYYEPVSEIQQNTMNEQVFHSQAIQTKSKNLSIKLSINQNQYQIVDLIYIDPKHLIHQSNLNLDDLEKNCYSPIKIGFNLEFNFKSTLGQIVRFYFVLIPAFLACILQLHDLILVLQNDTNLKPNRLFIDYFNTDLYKHLLFSFGLVLLNYCIDSTFIKYLFLNNDFDRLENENINTTFMPFLLYWCAYAVLGISCIFLTLIYTIFSFVLNNFILKLFSFLNLNIVQTIIEIFYFIVVPASSYLCSTLTHCGIFYGEFIRLSKHNPYYLETKDLFKNLISQTRLLFTYLLLVLNLPGLIVWAKSISNNDIQPIFFLFGDTGLSSAALSVLILILNRFNFLNKLKLNNFFAPSLILLNSILTVLYSSLSVYRLQYFILVHLFLMSLYQKEKSKQD